MSQGENVSGGAELQQYLIARELARSRGFAVSFITTRATTAPSFVAGGIQVIGASPGRASRALRLAGILKELVLLSPDIVYSRCATADACVCYIYTRMARRRFVYAAGSDLDVELDGPALARLGLNRFPWNRAIRNAARGAEILLAQTSEQASLATKHLGRTARILPNLVETRDRSAVDQEHPNRIVWVANFHRHKRPDLAISIAAMCPELSFTLVGAPRDDAYLTSIVELADRHRNVEILGALDHTAALELLSGSLALLNTTDQGHEGFPNAFLEAWSLGVPVVSLNADPERLLSDFGPGVQCGGDVEAAVLALRRLATDADYYEAMSQTAHKYVQTNHAPKVIGKRFAGMMKALAPSRGSQT